jgi:hypothetical protein
MHELLEAWTKWTPSAAPHILPADSLVLSEPATVEHWTTSCSSWVDYTSAPDFGKPGDERLHLGLLPCPFAGDLASAEVVILLQNPGLSPHDYYGEYMVQRYREAGVKSIRQQFAGSTHKFIYLDPQFAWHSGFTWWHGKLQGVIRELSASWDVSFSDARREVANRLAVLELVPYHSANSRPAMKVARQLTSVKLALDYVKSILLPRVNAGDLALIVTRQVSMWKLGKKSGAVLYTGNEARAAHLTPASSGGQRIIQHLKHRVNTPGSCRYG